MKSQNTIKINDIEILNGFWKTRQQQNASTAIFHQWEELEKSGCIENFRIAAGESQQFRTGFFFSDSDAHKWLDAACRIAIHHPMPSLKERIDNYVHLLQKAQESDGYLYTYNQIHFPKKRWIALQIEHELYCHGHLIEACIAHHQAFPETDLLKVANRAADLICDTFLDKAPHLQPGHQEIEIALLKLYEVTINIDYLTMAKQFLSRRGRQKWHGLRLLGAVLRSAGRGLSVNRQRKAFYKAHPSLSPFELPPMNESHVPKSTAFRFIANAASGKYFQSHKPIQDQTRPVGHAVRFGYTMTAATKVSRLSGDTDMLPVQEKIWRHMVCHRMYVTGGLGSLPLIEGFGQDDELDPKSAYAETCAAIASLFWNWELLLATGKSQYADLFEWQLYNAAQVGLGQNGRCYLYNNPLESEGELKRQPWFQIPCCPSNISRVFASLGSYIYTYQGSGLKVHQYINSRILPDSSSPILLEMQTGFPWQPEVDLTILDTRVTNPTLTLRVPGWASGYLLTINGQVTSREEHSFSAIETASGYDPFSSQYITIDQALSPDDRIKIIFDQQVRLYQTHPKARTGAADTAIGYGPIIYCFEEADNPDIDPEGIRINPQTISPGKNQVLDGIPTLTAETHKGRRITLIPYFAWANRNTGKMRVFFRT